jgi:hypothetical protein
MRKMICTPILAQPLIMGSIPPVIRATTSRAVGSFVEARVVMGMKITACLRICIWEGGLRSWPTAPRTSEIIGSVHAQGNAAPARTPGVHQGRHDSLFITRIPVYFWAVHQLRNIPNVVQTAALLGGGLAENKGSTAGLLGRSLTCRF